MVFHFRSPRHLNQPRFRNPQYSATDVMNELIYIGHTITDGIYNFLIDINCVFIVNVIIFYKVFFIIANNKYLNEK